MSVDRRTYLGGPDVAAIVGLSRYATPIDVFLVKTGQTTVEQTEAMRWGLLLEDAIAAGYSEQTGRKLQKRAVPVLHRDYPFLGGSPDRWIVGESGLVEMKAAHYTAGYGEPGTDQVPPGVRVQVVWYMGLTGRDFCDVVLFRGTRGLKPYTVAFDDVLYEYLLTEATRFWHEHVETGLPPMPDASEAYRRYLSQQHPVAEDIELVATPEQQLMVDELRSAIATRKAAEQHEDLIKNRLIAAMGDASLLLAPGARISYRNSAPSPRWKDIAERIGRVASLDVDAYRLADIEGRVGPRKFLTTFVEELEDVAA